MLGLPPLGNIRRFKRGSESEAYRFISDKMGKLAKYDVKIVSGEAKHLLTSPYFLETCKKLGERDVRVKAILYKEGIFNKLQRGVSKEEVMDDILSIYSSEKDKSAFEEVFRKGYLSLYFSPGYPIWHFTVIDGSHLLLQEKHKRGAEQKAHVFFENDFLYAPKYSHIFDTWSQSCTFFRMEQEE